MVIHYIFQSFFYPPNLSTFSPISSSDRLVFAFRLFHLFTSFFFFFDLHADTFEGSSSALLYGGICEWRTCKVGSPLSADVVFAFPRRPMIGRRLSDHFVWQVHVSELADLVSTGQPSCAEEMKVRKTV